MFLVAVTDFVVDFSAPGDKFSDGFFDDFLSVFS